MVVNSTAFVNETLSQETAVVRQFLECRDHASFEDVFHLFTPQLRAFYRARGCEKALAEDMTQDVLLTVYLKAGQLRDRDLFRPWLLRIARNVIYQHYARCKRHADSVQLDDSCESVPSGRAEPGSPAFEFSTWMRLLDSGEQEVMKLRFIEEMEYHEIADEKSMPIGTVQWRVFNAKKKLAPHLVSCRNAMRRAA